MKINWLIGLTCHQNRKNELRSLIESYGDIFIEYKPYQRLEGLINNDCPTFSFCSLPQSVDIIKYQRRCNLKNSMGTHSINMNPGVYCNLNNFRCSMYYPHYKDYLLNYPYFMLPYGSLISHKDIIFNTFGNNNCVFIRPDSGFKTFTGQVFYQETFEKTVKNCECVEPDSDVLCLISEPKNIKREYRLVIIDKKIITSSMYREDNKHIESLGCPEYVTDYCENVLKSVDFEPDPCYTIDICELKNGDLKVIELNSLSCSGLYECEFNKIIESLREHILNGGFVNERC